MTMDSLRELFEHELEDIYYAEHKLLDVLDQLAEDTEDEEIKQAFQEHRQETEGHVDRLEEVFEKVGIDAEEEECEGINGLIEEHEEFRQMDPEQGVKDVFHVTAAEKTEHYEIAAYGNLAFLADKLGMDEVADLLGQNLQEEEEALEKLKSLTENYDYEQFQAVA